MRFPSELLVAQDVEKRFAGVEALQGVSLSIRPGEIRSLVGENGSGKSTLIKIIAGVLPPDAGTIVLDGVPRPRLRPIDAIRAGLQVIYQDFSLFPNLSVAENIALNSFLERQRHWVDWSETLQLARGAIGQLAADLDPRREVGDLSVAEKQLVSIARALVQEARLIIMDEPTTALTHREVRTLFAIVKRLQRQGVSVLFVSHKLQEILEISEQISVLRNGQMVAEGPAAEFDPEKLFSLMTGQKARTRRLSGPGQGLTGRTALRVERLFRAGSFRDISFSIQPGEIVGLSGLLGSGRTDLALALFGLQPAERGRLFIRDKPVTCRTVPEAMGHGIAYLPEDRLVEGLFLEQSLERNLVVGVLDQLRTRAGLLDLEKAHALAVHWMDAFKIQALAARVPVQTLSGGNQQKIVLAKWLATEASVLILNSPTVGVDIGAKEDIHAKIGDLAQQGLAVLLISDDLPELAHLSHRILLMHEGRLVDELPAESCDEATLVTRLSELR